MTVTIQGIHANSSGTGSATVRGVFDSETFSVSPGATTTFAPTHQYHLGPWFDSPKVPFDLGCEPGATSPAVTPFNGNQHAGIQVLNAAQFPVATGPLSHVHRWGPPGSRPVASCQGQVTVKCARTGPLVPALTMTKPR